MLVSRIARREAPTLPPTAMVKEAIPKLMKEHGCALGIEADGKLLGIFTRDGLAKRVVQAKLDPEKTPLSEVMAPVGVTVPPDTDTSDALKRMLNAKQCYLPVVDGEGHLEGWVGICDLFQYTEADLEQELESLAAYIAADGPGG